MSPDVILLGMAVLPVVVLMLLRVNAALVFLSACLGDVLLQFVGSDANDFFNTFIPSVSGNNVKIIMVLLPAVLTTVFMIKTVRGARLFLNVLPALGTGLLLTLLIVPLLGPGLRHNILVSDGWRQVSQLQALIVGVSALACLLFLWLQRPKSSHDSKHHKHH